MDVKKEVEEGLTRFARNRVFESLEAGTFTRADYHRLLLMIFHQTYNGPAAFALAGGFCDPTDFEIRDYLLKHAEEESTHWQWVLDDLASSGYEGPDPRESFPPPACQDYVSFNYYAAMRCPVARLGIAMFLESVGPRFGEAYVPEIERQAEIGRDSLRFFTSHTVTDADHEVDLQAVLARRPDSEWECRWVVHAIGTAARLYTAMYDGAVG